MQSECNLSEISSTSLLSLALGSHRLNSLPHSLLIPQELHGDHRLETEDIKSNSDPAEAHLEILIELIDKGNACRKVATHDLLISHVVKMLDNLTQRVAMSCYQDPLACLKTVLTLYQHKHCPNFI